ncbi:hypothetical protein BJX61DRAFT_519835 [Aspergillus egyptiacus]|nr:hypothetical protein BJX61DRAFT_519835 [Aspergillus egyptiacus]
MGLVYLVLGAGIGVSGFLGLRQNVCVCDFDIEYSGVLDNEFLVWSSLQLIESSYRVLLEYHGSTLLVIKCSA